MYSQRLQVFQADYQGGWRNIGMFRQAPVSRANRLCRRRDLVLDNRCRRREDRVEATA